MATMSQPKTQVLFERENIMRHRLNKAGVYELKQKVDRVFKNKLLSFEEIKLDLVMNQFKN